MTKIERFEIVVANLQRMINESKELEDKFIEDKRAYCEATRSWLGKEMARFEQVIYAEKIVNLCLTGE